MNIATAYGWKAYPGYIIVEIIRHVDPWSKQTFNVGDIVICHERAEKDSRNGDYVRFVCTTDNSTRLGLSSHIIRIGEGIHKYGKVLQVSNKKPLNWEDYMIAVAKKQKQSDNKGEV